MGESSDDEEVGVLIAAKDVALTPLRVAVSKPARRAYLSTALFLLTSLLLLATAAVAYVLFYYSYIPYRGFSRPLYLQYDQDRSPYGTVTFPREIISNTPYDVKVVLHMPRTPTNRAAGNFMLNVQLLGPEESTSDATTAGLANVITNARRPAILTYYSDTMEHVHRASGLLWYILGWKHEAETIEVNMMESVEFARGWRNIPASARVELQSDRSLQVYSASLAFTAKLKGLRYLMYKYRITSFLLFTGAFWSVEVGAALIIWSVLSFVVFRRSSVAEQQASQATGAASVKQEIKAEPDISDTERTFPSTSRQHPLRYESPAVKSEEESKPALADIPPAAEADVEDEDEDADFVLDDPAGLGRGFVDSGLGTSMESGTDRRDTVRRRRSGRMSGESDKRG